MSGSVPPFRVAGPIEQRLLDARMLVDLLGAASRLHPGRTDRALSAVRALTERGRWFAEGLGPRKVIRVGHRWFPRFFLPSWPSAAWTRWAEARLIEVGPGAAPSPYLSVVFLAITGRCALHCVHCSAVRERGGTMDHADPVSLDHWIRLVAQLQARGLMQLQLTGGEPLQRFDDLVALLSSMTPETDTWVNTSGVGMSPERAESLARAGLTGVIVSLDHWSPTQHDRFRGFPGAYAAATNAVRAAQTAGLVTALSLCPSHELATDAGLTRYADLAEALGVAFVRIIDPRPVGRWAGHDVRLSVDETETVDQFEARSNGDPGLRSRPVIVGYDRISRKLGCLAAGDTGFYIDSAGLAHACPFCGSSAGSVVDGGLDDVIARLRSGGCSTHPAARLHAHRPTGAEQGTLTPTRRTECASQ